VFRWFRSLVEAIKALTDALEDIARIQRELGPAVERLDRIELSRHQWEAEIEGMLLKADGKLKAAAASEQRERQLKKANQRLDTEFDPVGEDGTPPATDAGHDAPGGEAPGMPPVRLALAPNNKALAVRAKWGIA